MSNDRERTWIRVPGMRTRIMAGFALGAFGLSVVLSFVTYELVKNQSIRSTQDAARRQTFAAANLVRSELSPPLPADMAAFLNGLDNPSGTLPLLYVGGRWYSTSLASEATIPTGLREAVLNGTAAFQRFNFNGHPELGVGVPLPSVNASYFELISLADVAHNLDILLVSLLAASALTTIAGALVGRWATSRLLAPLTETAKAAVAIANGNWDTRLVANDNSLIDLVSSFNLMVEALESRIRRDARFASDVSHELRSPLTTIETALQVMERRRADLDDRAGQALDLLGLEVRRFERLVQDLLEISRTDDGTQRVSLEEVEASALVLQCLRTSGVDSSLVNVSESLAGAQLMADKRRIERVIANLVENAKSHGGGVVGVTATKAGSDLVVYVDDNGPGVAPDEREAIFERFSRGKLARKRSTNDGVGLGLSLVKEHIRLHGGDVWVEPREGGGSRFALKIPLAKT